MLSTDGVTDARAGPAELRAEGGLAAFLQGFPQLGGAAPVSGLIAVIEPSVSNVTDEVAVSVPARRRPAGAGPRPGAQQTPPSARRGA